MFNFHQITIEDIKYNNPNFPKISGHPYRILILGCSGSGKTNALINLINHKPDIDKIYLYSKNPNEAKYQLLINKRKSTDLKYFNDSKVFIEYSNGMDDIYENIEEYNPNKNDKHNVFTEVINNTALSSSDYERMQSIYLIKTY